MSTISDLQGFILEAKKAREPEQLQYNKLDAEIRRRTANGESGPEIDGLIGARETARQAVLSYDQEIRGHEDAIRREPKPERAGRR
jgi:hypothetical protein